MKYPRDTYIEYKVFCKSVVLEAKTLLDNFASASNITRILMIIAAVVGQSLAIFALLAVLTSAGALVYFGSMGALIAANPWFAAILAVLGGLGVGGSIYVLYQERETLSIVKEVVIDRYQGDFEALLSDIDNPQAEIPVKHVQSVEVLLKRSTVDLVNALHKVGKIDKGVFAAIVAKL